LVIPEGFTVDAFRAPYKGEKYINSSGDVRLAGQLYGDGVGKLPILRTISESTVWESVTDELVEKHGRLECDVRQNELSEWRKDTICAVRPGKEYPFVGVNENWKYCRVAMIGSVPAVLKKEPAPEVPEVAPCTVPRPPAVYCKHCGDEIFLSGSRWRHSSLGNVRCKSETVAEVDRGGNLNLNCKHCGEPVYHTSAGGLHRLTCAPKCTANTVAEPK
jgi:hypothetical protein